MYHKSKETLQERNEIRSIPIFLQYAVQSAGLQSETRSVVARNNNRGDAEESADKKIKSLLQEIYQGLKFEVYEATRTVVDLPMISKKLQAPDGGSVKVATTDFPSFLRAVNEIPIRSLKTVPNDILKGQYREFLERLEKLTAAFTSVQLKDLDPKYLIKKLFDPKENLYTNIEMIM